MRVPIRFFLMLMVLLAQPANAVAQVVACATHADVSAALKKRFGEEAVVIGITSRGELIELYSSPKGTWTVVLTSTAGLSCIFSEGTDLEFIPPKNLPST